MTDVISEVEMAERIAALTTSQQDGRFRYYRPLGDAVDEYVHWATTPETRIYLGLEAFDSVMRGTAPGEMTALTGYTQSGKTLLLTNMMEYNADKCVAWFTPDETRVLVMVRLACVMHGVSAQTIEQGLMEGNIEVRNMLRETAERFPMLGVYDEGLDVLQMKHALEEQMEATGREPQAIVFDYASLLNHEGDVRGRVEALKNFGKNLNKPMFVILQSSRTKGRDGERVALDSSEYGGEQQATHIIGVRRKFQYYTSVIEELEKKLANPTANNVSDLSYALEEARHEQQAHRATVTVSLVKNKRPPGSLVDEIDFALDTSTGKLLTHAPYRPQEPEVQKLIRHTIFGDEEG